MYVNRDSISINILLNKNNNNNNNNDNDKIFDMDCATVLGIYILYYFQSFFFFDLFL